MIKYAQMTPEQQQVWNKINEMMDVSYGCAESFVAAVGEHLWGSLPPGPCGVGCRTGVGFGGEETVFHQEYLLFHLQQIQH